MLATDIRTYNAYIYIHIYVYIYFAFLHEILSLNLRLAVKVNRNLFNVPFFYYLISPFQLQ